jgi:hypothetical protein
MQGAWCAEGLGQDVTGEYRAGDGSSGGGDAVAEESSAIHGSRWRASGCGGVQSCGGAAPPGRE